MGVYGAKVYTEFRQTGDLVAPWPTLPHRWHLMDAPTKTTALLIAGMVALLLGLLVERLIFRPLRNAPALSKAVASLGLLLALQKTVTINFTARRGAGVSGVMDIDLIGNGTIKLLGVEVGRERVFLAIAAVLVAGMIELTLRTTSLGRAVRAVADSEKGALLSGISTDRIAAIAWMTSSFLATAAMIFIREGTGAGEDPNTAVLLLIPALAAAFIGGMRSVWLTTAAAVALGLLRGIITQWHLLRSDWVTDHIPWFPKSHLPEAAPAIVLLVVLVLRRNILQPRSIHQESPPPVAPPPRRPWAIALGVLLIGTISLLLAGANVRQGIVISATVGLMSLSIVVITGYVGQVSLAQYAFAGIAAFLTARLVNVSGWPALLAILVGIMVAVAIAVAMALPTLRVRGMSFAVATLAVATIVEELVLPSSGLSSPGVAIRVANPTLFGVDLGFAAPGSGNFRPTFGIIAIAIFALSIWVVGNLRRSATGLEWIAVRTDEYAAAAAGIDLRYSRVLAFATSAAIAASAGVLRLYAGPMTPEDVLSFLSLAVIGFTFATGVGSLWGAVLAGLLAPNGILKALGWVSNTDYIYVLNGVVLILITIWFPEGITGAARIRSRRVRTSV